MEPYGISSTVTDRQISPSDQVKFTNWDSEDINSQSLGGKLKIVVRPTQLGADIIGK